MALRLVALAQEGKEVSAEAIIRGDPADVPRQTASPVQSIWEIKDSDLVVYDKMFEKYGVANQSSIILRQNKLFWPPNRTLSS